MLRLHAEAGGGGGGSKLNARQKAIVKGTAAARKQLGLPSRGQVRKANNARG